MRKQPIRDEIQILQDHDDRTKSLTHLIQDEVIDLGITEDDWEYDAIMAGLEVLTVVLNRSIITRNQQLRTDDDPRHERYPYEH